MNNGNGSDQQTIRNLGLITVSGDRVVTPEDFQTNRDQFARARALLERLERQNLEGYERWLQTRRELMAAAEAGRQAEYVSYTLLRYGGSPVDRRQMLAQMSQYTPTVYVHGFRSRFF